MPFESSLERSLIHRYVNLFPENGLVYVKTSISLSRLCRHNPGNMAKPHIGSTNYWSLGYSRSWECFFFFSMFGFPERSARDCSHWTLACVLHNAHHQPWDSQNYMCPRKQLHLHWVKGFIRFLSLESTRIWKQRYDQKANGKPNPTLYSQQQGQRQIWYLYYIF